MPVLNIFTNPPASIDEGLKKELERIKQIKKDKNIKVKKDKLDDIANKIWKEYTAWDRQSKPYRRHLVTLNEMLEGVVEETNFPFEGASNITISYASGMARTFKATFNKTAFQDADIFSAVTKDEELKPQIDKVEEGINYSFHSECNGLDILKQGTIPLVRDGTLIISGFWDRRIEKCSDSRSYKAFADFQTDYPNFSAAGISEEEYQDIADTFIKNDDVEVICNYQFDNILYDGPAYEIVPLVRFVYYPIHAPRIRDMKMYGKEYFVTADKLREAAARKDFYKDAVTELITKKVSGEKDTWSASKNFIEKIANSPIDEDKPFRLVDAVWKCDLDGDGIQEKYLVTFSAEHKGIILSFQNYHIRNNVDFCVDLRLASREDRFRGSSLLEEGQDKFKLLDTIHRNRVNIRMLCTSPIMLVQRALKEELDFFRAENIVKPGVTYYVDDVDKAAKQMVIQNLDQPGNSLDEENQIVRYLEFCLGPTQAMSGKETGADPRAPMGKTIALLQQANGRIDDYLDEYRRSLPELANLHSALLAQFGPEKIKYNIEQDGKMVVKEMDRDVLFKKSIIWRAKRRSVTLSPEFAMQRLGGLLQTYNSLLPLIMQQDPRAIEMWNRMVIASGEPNKEKLMIQIQVTPPGVVPPNHPINQILNGQPGAQPGQGAPMPGMQPLPQSVVSETPQ